MRTTRTLALTIALLASLAATATALAAAAPRPASAPRSPIAVVAKNCGDRYGQFTFGHQGLLVLKLRGVPCAEVKKLARTLVRKGPKVALDGYRCARDPKVQAGGGASRCVNGRRSVEFGFE